MIVELLDLRAARERDEVTPYFQPHVELRIDVLSSVGILTRWRCLLLGLILPTNGVAKNIGARRSFEFCVDHL